MKEVERSVAIIRPKAPFLKWANSLGQGIGGYSSDDTIAFLIPFLMSKDASPIDTLGWRYINSNWDGIFREMLHRCEEAEWRWPQYRTRKMFGEWLKVEFHCWVIDAVSYE